MTNPILVTGGTGTLGRAVVRRLLDADHEVRVLSRRPRPADDRAPYAWMTGDLRSGAGIAPAVAGVDVIVHCASGARGDVEAARNLIETARRAGAPHLTYISIVGVDRVPFRYYRTKLEVERLVEASGLPWTILRATQFHDLIFSVVKALARSPVMVVPASTSFQPVDADEVAARLVELATSEPAERVPDMGGPQVLSTRDLAAAYLRASGRRRAILPVRLPGAVFAGYRKGGHLAPDHAEGRRTWEEFLAERLTRSAGPDRSEGARAEERR